MMKVFAAAEAGRTQFADIPIPEPEADEALVKIEGCVICNTTDWMVINQHFGAPDFPVIIGHESVGRVIQVGGNVRYLKIGDRVTRANAIISGFNDGYYSAWGGFSEYGIVKDKPVIAGYGDLSLEAAGLLISLSETASCLLQIESIQGKDVLVMGTGIAGLSLVYFAKKFGAKRVICTGRRSERLKLAAQLGADEVYLGRDLEHLEIRANIPEVDWVLEATGQYNVFGEGIPLLKNNGTLAIYGVPEKPYVFNPQKSPDSYEKIVLAPKEDMAYQSVCDLLSSDTFLTDILITHRWTFDELPQAFDQVKHGEVIKGIVRMI